MNSKVGGWIVAVSLILPAVAAAQPAAPAKDERPAPGQRAQMYEDIEILRRLLNSKLVSEYPPAKALAEAQNSAVPYRNLLHNDFLAPQDYQLQTERAVRWLGQHPYNTLSQYQLLGTTYDLSRTTLALPPAPGLDTEGTYLKGQGVVYTLTLPPPTRNPKEQWSKPTPKNVSDWDRIRGELHNEKPDSEAEERKEQPRKEPSLTEIVLEVLAENGRHFTQLDANESLTVIVTFRGDDPPPAQTTDPQKPKTHQFSDPGSSSQGTASNAHDYELLADLHLKQGKYEEAVKTLRQALELNPGAKQAAGLYRKLAEANLGLGRDAEARQAIDKAMELAKAGQAEAPEPAKQPQATRPRLPAKLMISAPKKLLDDVGSGRITVEEFRKGATVDYLTFSDAKE